ncbi:MAG: type II secretion system F family protein [Gammaproteobacteria bacterium]|nr:type II secretion system F family protein [Gammaproteobacteria bacterium]
MNNPYSIYVLSFLVFIAAVGAVEAVYLIWRSMKVAESVKISRRIKAMSAGGEHGREVLQLLRNHQLTTIPWLERILSAFPRFHALDRLIQQSGVNISLVKFLGLQLGLVASIVLLLWAFFNVLFVFALLIALVVGVSVPYIFIVRKRIARHEKFTNQMPDALDYLARSMRAGNPFVSSLRSAAEELPEPTGTEFGITFDEMNYGLELEDALYNLERRSGSEEMRFFVTAVLIQRTTGGNLADVLNRIAAVMRQRAITYRDIRILAAEMRLSANVLIALPFFVAAALSVLNPSYLPVLFEHKIGLIIIGLQLFFMLLGYVVIQRMINFRI